MKSDGHRSPELARWLHLHGLHGCICTFLPAGTSNWYLYRAIDGCPCEHSDAPPGWTALGESPWTDDDGSERTAHLFCKIIGPREIGPSFTTTDPDPEWEICGHAVTGYAPAGDGFPSLPR